MVVGVFRRSSPSDYNLLDGDGGNTGLSIAAEVSEETKHFRCGCDAENQEYDGCDVYGVHVSISSLIAVSRKDRTVLPR